MKLITILAFQKHHLFLDWAKDTRIFLRKIPPQRQFFQLCVAGVQIVLIVSARVFPSLRQTGVQYGGGGRQ